MVKYAYFQPGAGTSRRLRRAAARHAQRDCPSHAAGLGYGPAVAVAAAMGRCLPLAVADVVGGRAIAQRYSPLTVWRLNIPAVVVAAEACLLRWWRPRIILLYLYLHAIARVPTASTRGVPTACACRPLPGPFARVPGALASVLAAPCARDRGPSVACVAAAAGPEADAGPWSRW